MNAITLILLWIVCFIGVFAGSKCPPRVQIYPCVCLNRKESRRHIETTVICQGFKNTNSLNKILPIFRFMEIDKLLIYDSFWGAEIDQTALPNDWFSITNIKEFEIHDSILESCFACHWTMSCRNSVTTVFKVINSTSSDSVCTVCDLENESRSPMLSCLSRLESFALSHGSLKALTTNFFPLTLRDLKILDLSYNQIRVIDQNVLKNVPNLKHLDLSHNAIERIHHAFGQRTILEYVDLSHNLLKTIGGDLIAVLHKVKFLNLAENVITDFKETDFRRSIFPSHLKNIDLSGNPIKCDCPLRWVNGTFPVNVTIAGTCANPEEYKGSKIRITSRHLIERCDSSGILGTRKRKTSSGSRS